MLFSSALRPPSHLQATGESPQQIAPCAAIYGPLTHFLMWLNTLKTRHESPKVSAGRYNALQRKQNSLSWTVRATSGRALSHNKMTDWEVA
jgi:hypothetical protein